MQTPWNHPRNNNNDKKRRFLYSAYHLGVPMCVRKKEKEKQERIKQVCISSLLHTVKVHKNTEKFEN